MFFDKNRYYGYIVKGDLIGAIGYVKQFPEQAALYHRFMTVFDEEQYIIYELDADLNKILTLYQQYYRDVFYLCIDKEKSDRKLQNNFAMLFGITDKCVELCDLEENQIAKAFESRGLHFLGGKSSGYFGPYIWKSTEIVDCIVELPDGHQHYTVKLLDGFICRSWIDYLSFGEIGTGGWSDGDGIINCVKSTYDFESENFKVSLLKHEAQHAIDLAKYKSMSSEDLEYRAKLVELIYSKERQLLGEFIHEADTRNESNGHARAAYRIMMGFAEKTGQPIDELPAIPIECVQAIAIQLFSESNKEMLMQ